MRALPALLLCAAVAAADDRPDLLVADFEADTYGDWKTTGTAFGDRPARGTLPNQMPVSGFLGKGLVNSYAGGDGTTGTLTSPEFTVDRKFISFLIGGGKAEGKTCINLLVGGKVVRSATGPNDKPGGSENLDWHSWDVAEFAGKKAILQIVDDATGGWGHINIDHVVQTDRKKAAELRTREFTIDQKYLHLPVKNGAPVKRMKFEVDGKTVRDFDIELADDRPDFFVFADVSAFAGKKLKVSAVLMTDSKALAGIAATDDLPTPRGMYEEKLRPRFHFTSRRGWLNDPNGLVHDGKEWHLFYQHNPYGTEWGNMHWGHAVSTDLFRWTELGIGLYPRTHDDMAFSGSAVLDKENTSGWGTREKPPLVLAYTSTGRGECIAYSTDSGRTWTEYEKNPVVKHAGRDPKLIWHVPSKQWVMAVYDEPKGKQQIVFHTSPDLKTWNYASTIDGFFECPDLFELPVEGEKGATKWVLYAADGKYILGKFDGKTFTKESGKHQLWYGNFYAAQSYDNAPDGRRVQIGWARGVTFPGMPFNQQMNVPVELTLVKTGGEVRMHARPARELATLTEPKAELKGVQLSDRPTTLLSDVDAAELTIEFDPAATKSLRVKVRGLDLVYDGARRTLTAGKETAPLPGDGPVDLQILIDRGSVEVFANRGAVALSVAHVAPEKETAVTATGAGTLTKVVGRTIKSAWK
ncbi:MAG TPA: GH32 C-terminal domain-containing protein [Gemmataceae bacterium]|nr:GH32 C-terminal domain-containing protein [Gemmataceae bacterium]